jgi:hypothetical protein
MHLCGVECRNVRREETDMRASVVTIAACALLALSGCGNEDTNWEADALGGRADPPNDPSALDAAPGRLSETSPPFAAASDAVQPVQDEASADTDDQRPRR